jgi:hypothetical protein
VPTVLIPIEKPATRNTQPIGFSGRLDARTIPIATPAMFTTSLRTFAKSQWPEEAAAGSATLRSMNIRASAPTISTIEKIPTGAK